MDTLEYLQSNVRCRNISEVPMLEYLQNYLVGLYLGLIILGQIVSASGQIFRSDFRPQDEIFRPGMPFRPLDEQALRRCVDVFTSRK